MAAECKMRIQIEQGDIVDIIDYGFYLGKSPNTIVCDLKDSNFVTTDFPENDGDTLFVKPIPTKKAFEYPITFIYVSTEINTANQVISNFYNSLLGKKVTIYNDYKKVKVVGYVKSFKGADFYRDEQDIITFEVTFYVPKPQECDFNLSTPLTL